MATKERALWEAAETNRAADVLALLRDNPEINVNWAEQELKRTALHHASENGHVEVVKLLLAHPNIYVNAKNGIGQTPFLRGCLAKCLLFN